jgi:ribosome-binding factor A
MSLYRKQRLESVIQDLLSKEIVKTIETENALITVTGVEIDEERDKTIITISVYPDEKKKDALIKLNGQAPQLAWFLVKKIRVKKIPQLLFR